jgi:DNA-binding transcriptional LysR family regulator
MLKLGSPASSRPVWCGSTCIARRRDISSCPAFRAFSTPIRISALHIGEAHQALDMVREGFDCMLRAGELTVDSALIRRRLATLERGTFASPAYITRFGMPAPVDALETDGHRMVGFYAPDAPEVAPFNFLVEGKSRRLSLPSFITVTGPETNVASACMGLGLIQIPRYRAAAELASGKLVEVLPQFPPSALPVHVLYSHTRQLSPRLRAVIGWMWTA